MRVYIHTHYLGKNVLFNIPSNVVKAYFAFKQRNNGLNIVSVNQISPVVHSQYLSSINELLDNVFLVK